MLTVYIGFRQLKAPSVSPRDRRAPATWVVFSLRAAVRRVGEMTRNLISLVSVLSTPTRGLGAVLASHAGSYSHVRFMRRGLAKAASRPFETSLKRLKCANSAHSPMAW
jgi:hypothetical protein